MNGSNQQCRLRLKSEWENWIYQILNREWEEKIWYGSQITFMFNHIPGKLDWKCKVMENEIERIYRTLVPHVERNPRSPSGAKRLPILIAFPDYPGPKKHRDRLDVTINDGLHYHGMILIQIESRLRVRLETHIEEHYHHYVRSGDILRRLFVQRLHPSG
jgi:hypothetical protein